MVITVAALAVRGCINERDARITEQAARVALFKRDSAQIAALRDSLVSSREGYDSSAEALRSALRSYKKVQPVTPAVPRPTLAEIKHENVSPAVVIELCSEFLMAADQYKLYADSTIAAQARVINNLQHITPKVVKKSSKKWLVTTFLAGATVAAVTVAAVSR